RAHLGPPNRRRLRGRRGSPERLVMTRMPRDRRPDELRIFSFNVNGFRACVRKGFFDWYAAETADIMGLQETRATEEQLAKVEREAAPESLRIGAKGGVETAYVSAERRGYSGVGLLSRIG